MRDDSSVLVERSFDKHFLVYISVQTQSAFQSNDVGVKVFSPFYRWPVYHIRQPAFSQNGYTDWVAFCFDGEEGIKGLYPVGKYVSVEPTFDICKI